MKRAIVFLSCFLLLFVLCLKVAAAEEEKATKEECVAKCKEAANLIKEIGLDAAMAKIQDPKGPFVWKDSYVFAQDLDGKFLAHPMAPGLVGKNTSGAKDVSGKMFGMEMLEIAKTSGEGWVDFMWPKPGDKTPVPKSAFIYRVPGQNLLVGAGVYK